MGERFSEWEKSEFELVDWSSQHKQIQTAEQFAGCGCKGPQHGLSVAFDTAFAPVFYYTLRTSP